MKYLILIFFVTIYSCNNAQPKNNTVYKTTGTVERLQAELDAIIAEDATGEIISEGFKWSEGPLWIESEKMLLFSDVPKNIVYKWTEKNGTEIYLQPSGYTGTEPNSSKEPGSNGLLLSPDNALVLCQHGNRSMSAMIAPLHTPKANFITLASHYKDKRFSSPNDAAYHNNGELYFTDPPYGLPTQGDADPLKETPINGVYKIKQNGEVVLLVDSITRPNGIAFFPDYKQLIVASSDHKNPNWYIYDVENDALTNGKVFYPEISNTTDKPGLPDGLKINKKGIVFATGPGGIFIFNRQAKLLGKIKLSAPASNLALSADEKILYITNNNQILRVALK